MFISVGHFGFMNFHLGGLGFQIRNQRLCKLPSTEFHPNQITFGISNRHIRSGVPYLGLALTPPTIVYSIKNI